MRLAPSRLSAERSDEEITPSCSSAGERSFVLASAASSPVPRQRRIGCIRLAIANAVGRLAVSRHLGDHARIAGFAGVDEIAGQQQGHSLGLADGMDRRRGAPGPGMAPSLTSGTPNLVDSPRSTVTGQRQFQASASFSTAATTAREALQFRPAATCRRIGRPAAVRRAESRRP